MNIPIASKFMVFNEPFLSFPRTYSRAGGFLVMGRKRELKNVHSKRPPRYNPKDPDELNEWGEELAQMTHRRRQHNERHKPGKRS